MDTTGKVRSLQCHLPSQCFGLSHLFLVAGIGQDEAVEVPISNMANDRSCSIIGIETILKWGGVLLSRKGVWHQT